MSSWWKSPEASMARPELGSHRPAPRITMRPKCDGKMVASQSGSIWPSQSESGKAGDAGGHRGRHSLAPAACTVAGVSIENRLDDLAHHHWTPLKGIRHGLDTSRHWPAYRRPDLERCLRDHD